MSKVKRMLDTIMFLIIINGIFTIITFRIEMDLVSEYLDGQIRLDEFKTNKLKSIEHKLDSLIESSTK